VRDLLTLRDPQGAKAVLDRLAAVPAHVFPPDPLTTLELRRARITTLVELGELDAAGESARQLIDQLAPTNHDAWKVVATLLAFRVAMKSGDAAGAKRFATDAAAFTIGPEAAWLRGSALLGMLEADVAIDPNAYSSGRVREVREHWSALAEQSGLLHLLEILGSTAVAGRAPDDAVALFDEAASLGARLWGEDSTPHLYYRQRLEDLRQNPANPNNAVHDRWLRRVQSATAWHREILLADWPLPTSRRDRWRVLPAAETARLVETVIGRQLKSNFIVLPERFRVRSARSTPVSFYQDFELVEVLVQDENNAWGCFGVLRDDMHTVILSGNAEDIYDLNLAERLSLAEDSERAIAYLRFVSSWFMTGEGPFLLVEDLDEAPQLTVQTQRGWIASQVIPVMEVPGEPGCRTLEAFVVYGGHAFRARFRLDANGGVSMLHDQQLSADPIFRGWKVRAGARFLA
jgi:hypothetical protein